MKLEVKDLVKTAELPTHIVGNLQGIEPEDMEENRGMTTDEVHNLIEEMRNDEGSLWTDSSGNLYTYSSSPDDCVFTVPGIYVIGCDDEDHLFELALADSYEEAQQTEDEHNSRLSHLMGHFSETNAWKLCAEEQDSIRKRIEEIFTADTLREFPFYRAVAMDGDLIRYNPDTQCFETLESEAYRDGWVALPVDKYRKNYPGDAYINRFLLRYGVKSFITSEAEFEEKFAERPQAQEGEVTTARAILTAPIAHRDDVFLSSHQDATLYLKKDPKTGEILVCPVEKAVGDNPLMQLFRGSKLFAEVASPGILYEGGLFAPIVEGEHVFNIMDALYAPYRWVDGDGNVVGESR